MSINKSARILCLYEESQTYTSTVFEHIDSFRKFSVFEWYYTGIKNVLDTGLDLENFDVIVVHYTVRLPFGQLTPAAANKLCGSAALKVLFIQDEYDNTNRAKTFIKMSGFDLVFSVVPPPSIGVIYPPEEFPGVRFVSNFTGYVPHDLSFLIGKTVQPSQRSLLVAYRGRSLPLRYGQLGMEKVEIGVRVQQYCQQRGISHDIAWGEEARIYGDDWYRFISSARSMLGSESGSNVFDWDGMLHNRIEDYRRRNRSVSQGDIYRRVVAPCEIDGLMNQLSPRIFEMAASKTAMILFEGKYSNVLVPYRHFLPLRKDFGNLDDIFSFLKDGREVDEMADRAHEDLIASGNYSYQQFVAMVDAEIRSALTARGRTRTLPLKIDLVLIKSEPLKAKPPIPWLQTGGSSRFKYWIVRTLYATWVRIPVKMRPVLKRILRRS